MASRGLTLVNDYMHFYPHARCTALTDMDTPIASRKYALLCGAHSTHIHKEGTPLNITTWAHVCFTTYVVTGYTCTMEMLCPKRACAADEQAKRW